VPDNSYDVCRSLLIADGVAAEHIRDGAGTDWHAIVGSGLEFGVVWDGTGYVTTDPENGGAGTPCNWGRNVRRMLWAFGQEDTQPRA